MKEIEEDTLLASTHTHEILSIPLSLPVELMVKKTMAPPTQPVTTLSPPPNHFVFR